MLIVPVGHIADMTRLSRGHVPLRGMYLEYTRLLTRAPPLTRLTRGFIKDKKQKKLNRQ